MLSAGRRCAFNGLFVITNLGAVAFRVPRRPTEAREQRVALVIGSKRYRRFLFGLGYDRLAVPLMVIPCARRCRRISNQL